MASLDGIVKLLQFNQESQSASRSSNSSYKVLILDNFCKDLLAPLVRVNDLRKHGVTLHLGIESARQPIEEVIDNLNSSIHQKAVVVRMKHIQFVPWSMYSRIPFNIHLLPERTEPEAKKGCRMVIMFSCSCCWNIELVHESV